MINIYIESGVNQAKRKSKETTNEQDFLVKFIEHHFPGKVRGTDFEVIGFGGKDTLANNVSILADSVIQGNENIVIFDADTTSNQGGYQKRKAEIEEIKATNNMQFNLFLWPNNHDDGDFESLLLKMINLDHQGILSCFDNFVMCVGGHDPEEKLYDLPGRKSEIYTYIELMRKTPQQQDAFKLGYWLFNNPSFWNLDAEAGSSLYKFLNDFLGK